MISNRLFCSAIVLTIFAISPLTKANHLQHISDIDLSQIDIVSDQSSQDLSSQLEKALQIESENDDIETPTLKAVTAAQVSPIVSSLLTSMENALGPLLGPLAPLSSVISPMINTAVTNLFVGAINALLGAAKKNTLGQINGYDSYVIDIPNQGSYLLLSKNSKLQTNSLAQAFGTNSADTFVVNSMNNFLENPMIPNVAAAPITDTLLDNLNHVGPLANVNKPHRKFPGLPIRRRIKKRPTFLIPLNLVQAANGNLNTFAKSRSGSPLTDYVVDFN